MDLLADAIFYVSYDDESMKPGLMAGKEGLLRTEPPGWHDQPEPGKVYGEYAPGLVGKALKFGAGIGTYAATGNITLSTCGAVSFWIKPVAWREHGDGGMTYFCTEFASIGVERLAGEIDRDGRLLANESNLAWISPAPGARNLTAGQGGLLENGKWHFLVFNWAWPTFSLSINGGAPSTQSLSQLPVQAVVGQKVFHLGSKGKPAPTLMDEVMIFSRPLNAAEIRLIYETVSSWAKKRNSASVVSQGLPGNNSTVSNDKQ
ncbi:MAG: hypothetical protein PHR35_00615 [Kiritimatiellae bacterium]|nr:hypothetical protein [Kiritimatiellia bacterium]